MVRKGPKTLPRRASDFTHLHLHCIAHTLTLTSSPTSPFLHTPWHPATICTIRIMTSNHLASHNLPRAQPPFWRACRTSPPRRRSCAHRDPKCALTFLDPLPLVLPCRSRRDTGGINYQTPSADRLPFLKSIKIATLPGICSLDIRPFL